MSEIQAWAQGRFRDNRRYDKWGKEDKENADRQERRLVRPSPHGNAICQCQHPDDAAWIAERLNLAAKQEAELAALREGLSVSHIARAVFRAITPPGALPDDWDSGAEIGANNAERVRYTMAASKILAALQEKGE